MNAKNSRSLKMLCCFEIIEIYIFLRYKILVITFGKFQNMYDSEKYVTECFQD